MHRFRISYSLNGDNVKNLNIVYDYQDINMKDHYISKFIINCSMIQGHAHSKAFIDRDVISSFDK